MPVESFTSSLDHILGELQRLDLLMRLQIERARREQSSDAGLQGLYVSEQEIDRILTQPLDPGRAGCGVSSLPVEARDAIERMSNEIAERKSASAQRGLILRLECLARLFQLNRFDIDALLICLAPELDLRYERLYAYLQDDVTKKRPSVDLILSLLCPSFETKITARDRFSRSAPLSSYHLIRLFDDPAQPEPPLLGRYVKLDERIAAYLLDSDEIDEHLLHCAQVLVPQTRLEGVILPGELKRTLTRLAREDGPKENGLVMYFQGAYGVGKQTTAGALCRELGQRLLVLDLNAIQDTEEHTFETTIELAGREARLQGAALYGEGFDTLLAEDESARRSMLLHTLARAPGLSFLAGETTWEPRDMPDLRFLRVEFHKPNYTERLQTWSRSLDGSLAPGADAELKRLASKFRLSGGQIRDAATTARQIALWRDPARGQVTPDDLYTACRLQSNRKLATLARKITPHYMWDDIILPEDRLQQLREICNYVKYRAQVYDEWGFDRKLALGKGLNILFAGPSGTGKTMAAEIIAGELGLDLYKIDLSTVVSKYIGETEKNLARIFAEAETSNAILFFDEADALFGKRSEVRDSHDRYANIEIAYLLQKMEEYEGVVILATNMRRNMDDAFVRRMHFTLEFPIPDENDRHRIWKRIFPDETPRGSDLDLDFMARRFEIAGGNIRNIALAAAFLAADDGAVVNMSHLIRATRREYQKMGKVVMDGEFGEYARLAGKD